MSHTLRGHRHVQSVYAFKPGKTRSGGKSKWLGLATPAPRYGTSRAGVSFRTPQCKDQHRPRSPHSMRRQRDEKNLPGRERTMPSHVSLPRRRGGRAPPPIRRIPGDSGRFPYTMWRERAPAGSPNGLCHARGGPLGVADGQFWRLRGPPVKDHGLQWPDCLSTANRHNSSNFLKALENRLGHEPFGSLARLLRGTVLRQPSTLRYSRDQRKVVRRVVLALPVNLWRVGVRISNGCEAPLQQGREPPMLALLRLCL